MPILQKKIKSDFTTVHNAFIRDKKLGINARGLLLTMLSMKEGWKFSVKGLASILPDGEKKVSTALHSLEELGYLRRTAIRDEKTKQIKEWTYSFSDEPIFRNEETVSTNSSNSPETNHNKPHRQNVDVAYADIAYTDIENDDVDNLDVDNRHYNQITSNQITSNQVLYNQSINQSIRQPSKNFIKPSNDNKKDRQTDRQINTKTINEIIRDIGYKGAYMNGEIFDDKNGLTDITVVLMKDCSIPKEYQKDKTSLRKALNIFVQWNYAYNGFKDQQDKELYSHIVETICSFLTNETTRFKDRNISYTHAFECLNKKIHTHGELYSWIVMAMDEWKSIISRTHIKNVAAYMKICVWNWLEGTELEVKNNADSYAAQTNYTNNYRPNYYNRSKDLYAEAASRPQSYDLELYERLAVNFAEYSDKTDG